MKQIYSDFRKRLSFNARMFRVFYLLYVLIPFVMAFTAYFLSARLLGEESAALKRTVLQAVMTEIESTFLQANILARQLFVKYDVLRLSTFDRPFSIADQYHIRLAIDELLPHKTSADQLISDFFIYYPGIDYVITAEAGYDADFFFSRVYGFVDFRSIGAFEDYLAESHSDLDPTAFRVQERENFEKRFLITVHPLHLSRRSEAFLVTLINVEIIQKALSKARSEETIFLLTSDDRVLLSNGDGLPAHPPLYASFPVESSDRWYTEIDGISQMVSYADSEYGPFRYVSAVPTRVFKKKVILIRNILVGLAVGMFLSSAIIVYRRSSTLSGLFSFVFERFSTQKKANWTGSGPGEINSMTEAINQAFLTQSRLEDQNRQLLIENEANKTRIRENATLVKDALLRKLLRGDTRQIQASPNLYTNYGISFVHSHCVVAAVQLAAPGGEDGEPGSRRGTTALILQSLISDVEIGGDVEQYLAQLGKDEFAIVLCFSGQRRHAAHWLRQTTVRLHAFINNHIDQTVTIGVSSIMPGVESLESGLHQARDALSYRIVKGSGAVIHFSDIVDVDKDYYYPIDIEIRLINGVRSGNLRMCRDLLEDVFGRNFDRRSPSPSMAQCLFFDMTSTVIKILDALNVPVDAVFPNETDPIDRIIQCNSVDDIRTMIVSTFEEACHFVNMCNGRRERSFAMEIRQYVDEHYSEIAFSQTMVADHFGVSTSHVSSTFKKHFSGNMQEYVVGRRLDKACACLEDPELLLSDIAERVGYTSDKTLIRLFKRYRGVTPGQYRKMNSIRSLKNIANN